MISGMYQAANGLMAQSLRLEVLTNNLANSDTPGFKEDLLAVMATTGGVAPSATPLEVVRPAGGAADSAPITLVGRQVTDHRPGILKRTENAFDLALPGEGYFVVETPQGPRYTRAGNFTLNAEGYLTTLGGHRVQGTNGPIKPNREGFVVDDRGRILDKGREVDSLRIVVPERLTDLTKEGYNLFQLAEGKSVRQIEQPAVRQSFLESSNVNVIQTMADMIAVLRTYEAHQRTIQSMDNAMRQANEDLGRVA